MTSLELQLLIQVVALLGMFGGVARYAIKLERRLMKIELKLGIEDEL